MKNLMSIIVVTSLFLFVSTTFSFGQEQVKKEKVDMRLVKMDKAKIDAARTLNSEDVQSKKVNIDNKKALKKRAKMHSQPARLERK